MSHIAPSNSSTLALGADATFVGQFVEVLAFASISVIVISDQPSATDGVRIEWSTNGVDVDDVQLYNYSGNSLGVSRVVQTAVRTRFFRVAYTNGSEPQALFRLQTLLSAHPAEVIPLLELKFAQIDVATAGDTTLLAPQIGRRIRVIAYTITTSDPMQIAFKSGDTVVVPGLFIEKAGGSLHYAGGLLGPAFQTAIGQPLVINLSLAKPVRGHLTYVEVP